MGSQYVNSVFSITYRQYILGRSSFVVAFFYSKRCKNDLKEVIKENIGSSENANVYENWRYLGRYFNNTVDKNKFHSEKLQAFGKRIKLIPIYIRVYGT